MRDFAFLNSAPDVSDVDDTKIRTEVIGTLADLRSRDADWLRLCTHPEAHPATFAAVCAANPHLIRPHVVLVFRGPAVIAMAIARLQVEPVSIRFGLSTLLAPKLSVVRVSYDGIVGDTSLDVFGRLMDALSEPLRTGEADAIFFDHITVGSSIHDWSTAPSGKLRADRCQTKVSQHWVANLKGGYDAFVANLSKHERTNLKTNHNRITRELGERVRMACYRQAADFTTIEADTSRVAVHTYQSALGASYVEQFWAGPLFKSSLELGLARCYILYVDEQPKAFCHGIGWRGHFHISFLGYDPSFASLSIGRYVLQHAIMDLSATGDTTCLDFGFGHAEYKRRLGSGSWDEIDRYVFARRLKPILVNHLRGICGVLARGADSVLRRLELRDQIKRLWKDWLMSRKKNSLGE